jgi:hypothetical protein
MVVIAQFSYYLGGDYKLITAVMFRDFITPRKEYLEWLGFDTGCINVEPMRAAMNSVYEQEEKRLPPYDE